MKKEWISIITLSKDSPFDAVIIDLMLLSEEIISEIKSFNTKIIAVSVYDSPYVERKAIESSVDFYLLLPCSIDEFVEIVKKVGR